MANYYEEQLAQSTSATSTDNSYSQAMLAHYRLLLERWEDTDAN